MHKDEKFPDIKLNDNNIFKTAKQIKKGSKVITSGTYIKNKYRNLDFTNVTERQAWQKHFEKIWHAKFPWSEDNLPPMLF